MASSVITIFRWSIFRLSSVALITLWAFNPLGSQVSFRGIYLRPNFGTTHGDITSYNANLSIQLYLSPFGGASQRSKPTIRALYSACLYDYISSTQYADPTNSATKGIITMLGGEKSAAIQASMDTWGNVRIPNLEYFDGYESDKPHRWLDVLWDQQVLNYSSLLGDRVVGVNRNFVGNTSFTITSSYQRYNCTPWLHLNSSTPSLNNTRGFVNANNSEADHWLISNTGKNYLDHISSSTRIYRTFFVSQSLLNMTKKRNVPELVFASRGNDPTSLVATKCTARTMYVDARVICISKGALGKAICGVQAMREMPNPPADPTEAVLGQSPYTVNSFTDFMDMLENNQVGSGQSSNTEYYLYNPLTAFTNPDDRRSYTELGTVDIKTFERRFSLLWNTLWKIAWAKKSVMGGNFSAPVNSPSGITRTIQNTTSDVTFPLPPVYTVDRAWLSLYFVSVSIMFLAAIFSLFMHTQCRAPAILGFVSSLIRDSIYFQDCGIERNSTEDGPEKSKRLGNLRVMVADVQGHKEEIGKIAFAPEGFGRRVEKRKWYD